MVVTMDWKQDEGNGELVFNRHSISIWGDENVLEINGGDGRPNNVNVFSATRKPLREAENRATGTMDLKPEHLGSNCTPSSYKLWDLTWDPFWASFCSSAHSPVAAAALEGCLEF